MVVKTSAVRMGLVFLDLMLLVDMQCQARCLVVGCEVKHLPHGDKLAMCGTIIPSLPNYQTRGIRFVSSNAGHQALPLPP